MTRHVALIFGTILYAVLCVFAYRYWVLTGLDFSGDAGSYNQGALHLLAQHFYSLDGIHPFFGREPLYSFFLAGIYAVFGTENTLAIYLVQAILYWAACLIFVSALEHRVSRRIASICFILLLTSPSVLHSIFIVYREALTLSMMLLLAASILSYVRKRNWYKALIIGMLLGLLPLVYFSFVFLPLGVLVYLWYERGKLEQLLVILILAIVITSAWGFRNQRATGTFMIVWPARTDILWYVRGEQSEKVRGLEPFLCLYAEYISRDWSHRSPACSFNSLQNTRWPQGLTVHDPSVSAAGIAKIKQHFGSYLWFSMFEILELHLPFVGGGWPHSFNIAAVFGSFVMYFGCLLGIRRIFSRQYILFLLMIAYNTVVFIFTDATPRYLIPVTFCYAVLAAVGYDAALRFLFQRK